MSWSLQLHTCEVIHCQRVNLSLRHLLHFFDLDIWNHWTISDMEAATATLNLGEGDVTGIGILRLDTAPETNGTSTRNSEQMQTRGAQVLKIGLIWHKIQSDLSMGDVLALRETCQTWNKILVPLIRDTHKPIYFKGPESLSTYTAVARTSLAIPFSKYCIRDVFGTMGSCCTRPMRYRFDWGAGAEPVKFFRDFVSVCGGVTRILTIGTGGFRTEAMQVVSEIRRPMFEPELLPHMTELSLSLKSVKKNKSSKSTDSSEFPTRVLFNLKRLEINNSTCDDNLGLIADLVQYACELEELALRDFRVTAVALPTLRDLAPNLNRLTTVELHGPTTDELLTLLELAGREHKPLRLTAFTVGLYETFNPADVTGVGIMLEQFLVTQSRSLKELSLIVIQTLGRHVGAHVIGPICIPRMDNLRTLRLCQPNARRDQRLRFEERLIADTLPNLKKLTYDTRDCEWNPYGIPYLVSQHEGVSNLILTICMDDMDLDVCHTHGHCPLRAAASCFPFVTELDIMLLDIHFMELHVLWTAWPHLRVLRMNYLGGVEQRRTLQLDEFLSGILNLQFADLKKELLDLEEIDLPVLQMLLVRYRVRPGLASLRSIRQLELNIGSWNTTELTASLTDIGGFFGFAMASPSLQRITLRASSFERENYDEVSTRPIKLQMSADCLAVIRRALGPSAIIQLMSAEHKPKQGQATRWMFTKRLRSLHI